MINPVMVMPVDALENAVAPDPVMVYVPDPVMVLVNAPVLANAALCTLYVEQANEPCVSVRAPLSVTAPASVAVPANVALPIINATIVLALVVTVLVPRIDAVSPVYVPLDDNVKSPSMFSDVVPGLNDVVPKSRLLNQLPVVSVATLAPVVNAKFGAVVVEPPEVLATENVLVLLMSATVNPPEPVHENPPAAAMFSTTVAAVVCVRLTKPTKGLKIELVAALLLVTVVL